MGGCCSCQHKGINLDSFAGRIQWALRSGLSFLIAAVLAYYFPEYIAVPFLLPVRVIVAGHRNFGTTMLISQSVYQGLTLICCISTVAYYIPILKPELWWCTLIYYFIIALFLCVILDPHPFARKLALALHSVYVMVIQYKPYPVYFIWETWLEVPMSTVIAAVGVLIPVPIFAYQQLIYAEGNAVLMLKQWLHDMMEYLYHSRDNKIVSEIQRVKLQKYVDRAKRSRQSITGILHVASSYEMVHADNLMIDRQRIQSLLGLHYILVGMHDAAQHLQYDDVHYELFAAIKQPLRLFVAEILRRLEDVSRHNVGAR